MKVALEIGTMAATAAGGVALRRLTSGARKPSWSFRTELFATLVRSLTDRSRQRGIGWMREAQSAVPASLPADLASVRHETVDADGVRCEWAIPPGMGVAAPDRAIVYFHGGGYVVGSTATHREICSRLAVNVAVPVLSVDYRLGPEHRFPAAQEDCLAATRWVRGQGVPASKLALAGDSAGGALAVATLLSLREAGEALPAGAALLCPWVDPLADGGTMRANEAFDFGTRELLVEWARAYASDAEIGDPRMTPLRADLAGLPPLLVQAGEAEVLLDQIQAFAERARQAGVTVEYESYPEMFHIWQVTVSMVPEGAPAVASIARFLRARLGP